MSASTTDSNDLQPLLSTPRILPSPPPAVWPGWQAVENMYQARLTVLQADNAPPLTHDRLQNSRYVLLPRENWAPNHTHWYPRPTNTTQPPPYHLGLYILSPPQPSNQDGSTHMDGSRSQPAGFYTSRLVSHTEASSTRHSHFDHQSYQDCCSAFLLVSFLMKLLMGMSSCSMGSMNATFPCSIRKRVILKMLLRSNHFAKRRTHCWRPERVTPT